MYTLANCPVQSIAATSRTHIAGLRLFCALTKFAYLALTGALEAAIVRRAKAGHYVTDVDTQPEKVLTSPDAARAGRRCHNPHGVRERESPTAHPSAQETRYLDP